MEEEELGTLIQKKGVGWRMTGHSDASVTACWPEASGGDGMGWCERLDDESPLRQTLV